jgi:hypothetical protein
MKTKLFLLICLIGSNLLFAQKEDTLIYITVNKAPYFLNGIESFHESICKKLIVPDEFTQNKEDVNIRVEFVVEKDGIISKAEVYFSRFECEKCKKPIENAYLQSEKWINESGKRVRLLVVFGYSPSQKSYYYSTNKPNLNKSDTFKKRVYVKPD